VLGHERDHAVPATATMVRAGRRRWHVGGMTNLGVLLKDGDPQAARRWWERAAAGGHHLAMSNVGRPLGDTGPGAVRGWYEQAAEAQAKTGQQGLGVPAFVTSSAISSRSRVAGSGPVRQRVGLRVGARKMEVLRGRILGPKRGLGLGPAGAPRM